MTAQDTDRDVPSAPRQRLLSPVQVAASALAAVSAAVVASFFGVAGTLIGAAVASVISTISATLYSESMRRTHARLRQARGERVRPDAWPARPAGARPGGAGPRPGALPARLDPRRAPAHGRPRWARVAVPAIAVFLLAMGVITAIELVGSRPVSALVAGSHHSSTTTVGQITDLGGSASTRSPSSPTTTPPATPSADTSAPAERSAVTGSATPWPTRSAPTGDAPPTRSAAPTQPDNPVPSTAGHPTAAESTTAP